MIDLGWLIVPGLVLYVAGVLWTIVGRSRSSESALRGIRLRLLGLVLSLGLPGGAIALMGILNGFDVGRIVAGLILLVFGLLYLYARGGLGPQLPMPWSAPARQPWPVLRGRARSVGGRQSDDDSGG